jgi:hypothetical protein
MFSGFLNAVGSTLRSLQMGFSSKQPAIDTRNVEVFPLSKMDESEENPKYTYSFEPEVNLAYNVVVPNSTGNYEIDSEDEICKHAGFSDLCDSTGCYFTKSIDDLVSVNLNTNVDCSLSDLSGNCQCTTEDLSGCSRNDAGICEKSDLKKSGYDISGSCLNDLSGANLINCDLTASSGSELIISDYSDDNDCIDNNQPLDCENPFKSCDELYSIEKHCFLNKIWYSKELTTDEIKKHLDID